MIPQEVIRKKRDGGKLSKDDFQYFIQGFVGESIPDYQTAALLMAIFTKGLDTEETAHLLAEMMNSGKVYDWQKTRALTGKKLVDKHSTGGIGDKTSLVVLPLLVADGLYVPMVAGRGLGHTGGTLDKLESLPGVVTRLSSSEFERIVLQEGGVFGAQTADFVPADKKLYALRDVTATVESIPLIVASIMSKKLAEGLDALVLDVKYGSGSFMGSVENARSLANHLVNAGRAAGCKVSAALTNMDVPLGRTAGNSLEVVECLEVLQNAGPADTRHLSIELAARASCLANDTLTPKGLSEATARMEKYLSSGRAFEIFCKILCEQGAQESDLLRTTTQWIAAGTTCFPLFPSQQGVVESINSRNLGLALIELGGGRKKADDEISPGVGLSAIKKPGEYVDASEPICYVHARSKEEFLSQQKFLQDSFSVRNNEVSQGRDVIQNQSSSLIFEWI